MKHLAIIPARSGSKGLKDKNIKLLCGKPLLAYTIEAAKQSEVFHEIFVSTDSAAYAQIAEEYGASAHFLRSKNLSGDLASSWSVVKDVIRHYEMADQYFDTIALLQPTSPLRTAQDILSAYSVMEKNDANSVVAVCEMEHSPLWAGRLPKNHSLDHFINKDIEHLPRQKLEPFYRINGAIYVIKTSYLFKTNDIYASKSYAIIMPKLRSIDIDDEVDFRIAELLMQSSFNE